MGETGGVRAPIGGYWITLRTQPKKPNRCSGLALAYPSGAITVRRKDGGAEEAPPVANQVALRENRRWRTCRLTVAGKGAMTHATLYHYWPVARISRSATNFLAGGFVATGELSLAADETGDLIWWRPVAVQPAARRAAGSRRSQNSATGTGARWRRVHAFICAGSRPAKPFRRIAPAGGLHRALMLSPPGALLVSGREEPVMPTSRAFSCWNRDHHPV